MSIGYQKNHIDQTIQSKGRKPVDGELYTKIQKPEIPIFFLLVENIVKGLNTLPGASTNPKNFDLN